MRLANLLNGLMLLIILILIHIIVIGNLFKRDVFRKVDQLLIQTEDKEIIRRLQEHDAQNHSTSIYFLETNPYRDQFDLRQICAIESAAYTNPDSNVYVFSLNAKLQMELLYPYKNIKYVKINIEEIVKDTVVEEFWKKVKNKFFEGQYAVAHLSDLLRLVILWKYGGYYTDLDTITIKNINPIIDYPGFGSIEDVGNVENSIFIFPKQHQFLSGALMEFIKSYDPNIWEINGPMLIFRTLNSICGVSNFTEKDTLDLSKVSSEAYLKEYSVSPIAKKLKNCNIWIYNKKHFNPITWFKIDTIFKENYSLPIELFIDTYSVHLFNKVSGQKKLKYGVHNILEYFASTYCPKTYDFLKLTALDSIRSK
jgi:hypothetical protein